MSKTSHITLVTGNVNKYNEIKTMMELLKINIKREDIDLVEIQHSGDEIVKHKCALAAYKLNCPVLVEDTSLEFTALNGLPGPYIKHFSKSIGSQGLYNLLEKYEDKSATAICYLAFSEGSGHPIHLFKGKLTGTIVEPRGETSFDWDNIFVPTGYNKTLSELGDEKNVISHRRNSVNMFSQFIASQCVKGIMKS